LKSPNRGRKLISMKKFIELKIFVQDSSNSRRMDKICIYGPEPSPAIPFFVCRIDSNSAIGPTGYHHFQNREEALEQSVGAVRSAYQGMRITNEKGRPIDLYKLAGLDTPLLGLPRERYRPTEKEKLALTKSVQISGFIKDEQSVRAVSARLEAPERIDTHTWRCVIDADVPGLPKKEISIKGVDALQARELAVKLILEMLEQKSLVDTQGAPIDLLAVAGIGKRILGIEKGPFEMMELPPVSLEKRVVFLEKNKEQEATIRLYGPVRVFPGEDDFAGLVEAPPLLLFLEWVFGNSPSEVLDRAEKKIQMRAGNRVLVDEL